MNLVADIGFGSVKVILGDKVEITGLYKFPSVLAKVEINALVQDTRAIEFGGEHYYVGEDALELPSASIIDVLSYEQLEFAAPIFLAKILKDHDPAPTNIVVGLSIAHINNSGHFKKRLDTFLESHGVAANVKLVPQGLIAKKTIDNFGVSFPDVPTAFKQFINYLLVDIGNNTIDVVSVINGKASTNVVRGIPDMGIMRVCRGLQVYLGEILNIKVSVKECTALLQARRISRRGKTHELGEQVDILFEDYIKEIVALIEKEFGDVMDKANSVVFVGGGAVYLQPYRDNYFLIPEKYQEYYNAIGMYEYAKEL